MPVGNPDSLAERSLMFLARPFPFLLAVLLSVMPGFSLAAEDAAIEVQETLFRLMTYGCNCRKQLIRLPI